ncbi:helix-turn-helix domain-containing protein [Nonomuraea sp. NBC_00507]|uniref:helix-turn-helix domain-containing protein n=1 Tax=Nonomuraea sp. NBC_00507 TaxID=2976002 RepID=UPI003FA5B5E3
MGAKRHDDEPLWNAQQVADYLNVTKRWVRREGPSYGLPFFKVGGQSRYRPAEIRAWLEQQRDRG